MASFLRDVFVLSITSHDLYKTDPPLTTVKCLIRLLTCDPLAAVGTQAGGKIRARPTRRKCGTKIPIITFTRVIVPTLQVTARS